MKLIAALSLVVGILATVARAGAPAPETSFRKVLSAAQKDNKMAFILMGRPSCSICNYTKGLIKDGKIGVTDAEFVMADLNIDDPKTQAEFMRKYGREKWGEMLPFVVVTDSHGKALANSSGSRSAADWNTLLEGAKAKAGAKTAR